MLDQFGRQIPQLVDGEVDEAFLEQVPLQPGLCTLPPLFAPGSIGRDDQQPKGQQGKEGTGSRGAESM